MSPYSLVNPPTITQLSAVELARLLAQGELSAVEVVEAHLARLAEIEPVINALVVRRFDEARREAAQADRDRQQGRTLGPLHGVPVTIKECLDVAGTASTLGIRGRALQVASNDGPLVARLRAAGAVVLGKTNVPQLAMYLETDGPLFGRTNNPWNPQRSPGGSSGGEAALIAAGGSPLGLATDAGGSIRQPAHCCGVCGLKPTAGRLTQGDLPVTTIRQGRVFMPANLAGLHAILQPGPLARSVADLDLALQVLAAPGQHEFDPTVPPIDWPDWRRVDPGRLRVGVYHDDGQFPVSPAIRRGVAQAAEALRRAGATVVAFRPPGVDEAMAVFRSLIFPDGGRAFQRMLGKEKLDPRLRQIMQGATLPNWLRRPVAAGLRWQGEHRLASSLGHIRRLSADEFRQRIAERASYTARFLHALDQQQIDVLVCPPSPVVAPVHGTGGPLGQMTSYTALYNLLGLPAGVVPVTRVRPGEEADRDPPRDSIERAAQAIETGSAGLPVGVQVAARPWREDVALAVMAVIEEAARAQADYPRTPISPGRIDAPGRTA